MKKKEKKESNDLIEKLIIFVSSIYFYARNNFVSITTSINDIQFFTKIKPNYFHIINLIRIFLEFRGNKKLNHRIFRTIISLSTRHTRHRTISLAIEPLLLQLITTLRSTRCENGISR